MSVLSYRVITHLRSRLLKYGDAASDATVPSITRSIDAWSADSWSQRALSLAAISTIDGAAKMRSSRSTASSLLRAETAVISLSGTFVTIVPARVSSDASVAGDEAV